MPRVGGQYVSADRANSMRRKKKEDVSIRGFGQQIQSAYNRITGILGRQNKPKQVERSKKMGPPNQRGVFYNKEGKAETGAPFNAGRYVGKKKREERMKNIQKSYGRNR